MVSPVKVWRNQKYITKNLGKKGKIVSYTLICVGPRGFKEQIPYPLVLVSLNSGERMVGQLVDWGASDLKIGVKVEAVLRRVRESHPEGVIPYGIKFRPVVS